MKVILLIEDNKDILENTCELLVLEGYEVIFTNNGKAGITMAKEKKPDLILCDINLPEVDGYEVFHELCIDAVTSKIPFIFFTSSAEEIEVAAGFDMGAVGYIKKPFEVEELFDTIEKCL